MRAAVDDLLQSFRFHVKATNADGVDVLQPNFQRPDLDDPRGMAEAGFQNASIPDITIDPVEYREGTMLFAQKYPGPPTVSECSLQRGTAKKDTAFLDWAMSALTGGEYRSDITIYHFQREEMALIPGAQFGDGDVRRIVCYNCFPMRVKPGADFDSMSGEVSLSDCDFAIERFEVIP